MQWPSGKGQKRTKRHVINSRHNTTQKTKDLATQTPLTIVMNSGTSER